MPRGIEGQHQAASHRPAMASTRCALTPFRPILAPAPAPDAIQVSSHAFSPAGRPGWRAGWSRRSVLSRPHARGQDRACTVDAGMPLGALHLGETLAPCFFPACRAGPACGERDRGRGRSGISGQGSRGCSGLVARRQQRVGRGLRGPARRTARAWHAPDARVAPAPPPCSASSLPRLAISPRPRPGAAAIPPPRPPPPPLDPPLHAHAPLRLPSSRRSAPCRAASRGRAGPRGQWARTGQVPGQQPPAAWSPPRLRPRRHGQVRVDSLHERTSPPAQPGPPSTCPTRARPDGPP